MNKLREEDCARREAQWVSPGSFISPTITLTGKLPLQSNTFDLRAQYEKISGFAKRMEARQGSSIYPNILASSLRAEFSRRRKQSQGQP